MRTERIRYAEIDATKGVAIIGVILAHASFKSRFDDKTLALIATLQIVFGWCVIAFFFTSGMLSKQPTGEFLANVKRRARQLLIPCIVFSVSYRLLLASISFANVVSWDIALPSTVNEVVLFLLVPIGPQFYFLYYLFVVTVGSHIVQIVIGYRGLYLLSAVALPVSYAILDSPTSGYGPDTSLIPMYAFSYVMGIRLALQHNQVSWQYFSLLFVPVCASVLSSGCLIPCYVVAVIVLMVLFQRMSRVAQVFNKLKLGQYSSSIFVWHAPVVLPVLSILLVRLVGGGPVVLAPIVASTVFSCYFIRFATFRLRILSLWRF